MRIRELTEMGFTSTGRGIVGKINRSLRAVIPLLLGLMACFSGPSLVHAEAAYAGKLTSIDSGSAPNFVIIIRAGKTDMIRARIGDAVLANDTVKTGRNVKAQITLSDDSVINISQESTFAVKGYFFSPRELKRNYVLKAFKGTIRFIISKALRKSDAVEAGWKDSTIAVESPTAVAGVKGTDFVVSVTGGKNPITDISVLEGLVSVRNIGFGVREAVMLRANQLSRIARNAMPTAAALLSDRQRILLLNFTTPKPRPKGQAEAPSPAKQNYSTEDIAKDLAGDTPVSEVIDQAAAAGIPLDQVITAVLNAGVDPEVVVYTAITGGYSAETVVQTAISSGALLDTVVSAAIVGGADPGWVVAGAVKGGADPSTVATSVSTSTGTDSPVYESPISNDSGSALDQIPTEPIVVQGGGETPSNQQASPY